MPIYASDSGGGDFAPAPEGTWQAVCVDVIDKGMVTSTFSGESKVAHKIQIRWQLDDAPDDGAGVRDDGKPWMVSRMFTLSLHEKAALRGFLESWRNRRFTTDELKKFDVETVVGACCQLQVLHDLSDNGKTWANVHAILPFPKGVAKLTARDYTRRGDAVESDADSEEAEF